MRSLALRMYEDDGIMNVTGNMGLVTRNYKACKIFFFRFCRGAFTVQNRIPPHCFCLFFFFDITSMKETPLLAGDGSGTAE